jgi:hypothetical protein
MGDEDDGLWEKPAWAKGGVKLKSTGKADAMKKDGNLAAAITFTPFKSEDHSNKYANQGGLRSTDVGAAVKSGEDLAAPITFTPFKNEDHSNRVANQEVLKQSEVGAAAKEGYDLAAVSSCLIFCFVFDEAEVLTAISFLFLFSATA